MTDLIARISAATEGSRQLDATIHQFITPELADAFPDHTGWVLGGDHDQPTKAPHYTTSVDAALRLVPENRMWFVGHLDPTDTRFAATISCGHVGSLEWRAIHRSAPLAIVIASLRARAVG